MLVGVIVWRQPSGGRVPRGTAVGERSAGQREGGGCKRKRRKKGGEVSFDAGTPLSASRPLATS